MSLDDPDHPTSPAANTRRAAKAAKETAKLELYRNNERGFTVSYTTSVAGGGTANIHIKNPSGSGVNLDLFNIQVSTQFRGQYAIYDVFSSDPSGGNSLGIDNLLMDSENTTPDTGNAVTNSEVSFTESGTHWESVLPSGGTGGNVVGGSAAGPEPILEPDREIVIQVTNDGTKTRPAALGIVYIERDV